MASQVTKHRSPSVGGGFCALYPRCGMNMSEQILIEVGADSVVLAIARSTAERAA